ncbi:FecR family protein [Dyadobacter psychrotolerans]|uniref:FecR family protein n=1 Tax=Dyadobacter psychrotolerans TaxID=2541721 RepID=A0A4R5DZP6_9BACT|nr:FecR family protein [Dyadobacter psychrotolerans]TDE18184.1 FecR family protein [Dyadobacter psychrotolerans]
MKDYHNYTLEDFLLDDQFRAWIAGQDHAGDEIWNEIAIHYPEKVALMYQAREIILSLIASNSGLSAPELENEVNRIMQTTGKKEIVAKSRPLFPIKWFSAAASVIIFTAIGWKITSDINQPQSVKAYSQYVSRIDEPLLEIVNETNVSKQVKLPDGSVVKLTPSSRISYAETFVRNHKREVYLTGEAFFDVEKDVKNPFFVYANGLLTRVVGTSFLIRAIDADVEVLVRSGRVTVVPIRDIAHQEKKNTELLLTPNQQALFSAKDNLISKSIVETPVEITKPESEPDFVFDNRPIGEVFSILEKAYGIPIIYDEAVMRHCFLRVALSNESFFSKLDIVCKTVGASYQVRDGQIIISGEGCE